MLKSDEIMGSSTGSVNTNEFSLHIGDLDTGADKFMVKKKGHDQIWIVFLYWPQKSHVDLSGR